MIKPTHFQTNPLVYIKKSLNPLANSTVSRSGIEFIIASLVKVTKENKFIDVIVSEFLDELFGFIKISTGEVASSEPGALIGFGCHQTDSL